MIDESDFWSTSDQLTQIHQWARARYAAPWAVFFAVLLRVSASTGPHVQLPGVIGGRASLNLMGAFVAPSGGGKGISDKVARLAWPANIKELPIGSGEGIAETFTMRGKESEDNERITAAIFNCPEIDILTGLESRQGSTILGTLKAFAMGEQLGSTNASKANSRNVAAHTYRGCLSVSAQPGHTGVIFSDTSGGTPQRFLWALTVDPDMPDDPGEDPEPLNHHLPGLLTRRHDDPDIVTEIVYGPDEIRREIIAAHLARQRGEGDALDGHWMLTRCKVAAVLAIMHHRTVVSDLDWQLSETVMAVSDRTRNWIVEQARHAARAKIRDRAMSRAAGEQFISDHKLDRAKKAILRWLDRDGQLARHDLRRKLKADLRDHFDPAIAELAAEGMIVATSVKNGVEYGLSGEGTRVPEVHPPKCQVSDRVPEVHGVPDETVADLETSSSNDSDRPKLSCPKWIKQHVAELRATGIQYVAAFAVYEAGIAAGYSKSSIGNAAQLCPDIRTAAVRAGVTWWCIDPTETVTYKPLPQFINDYLNSQTANAEVIDQDHFYTAVDAAGLDRTSARTALTRSGRIDSIPAHGQSQSDRIWRVKPKEAS
ncbi:hypothetical protein [Mycolicibacterium fortuitum]|uniref:hypothetical protein n=1 Tax=Mycolicibacterium fortuitum TaxID=1766 RepID=UPI001CE1D6B3|nr:hypothetical protein [Mycolicibacterium fortuitum]